MRNATEAFIFAESLCSGSTSDNYATCILNNMRFMPYSKDTSVSLVTNSSGIVSNADLPVVSGKTYVELKPIALSDIRARMLQKNDSGQIRFRCLDVFSQPLLPLIDLQDLGLENIASNLTISNAVGYNIPGSGTSQPTCTDGKTYYEGVPIVCLTGADTDTLRYYRTIYNIRSHIIYVNNILNDTDIGLMGIKNIIDNNGDYNQLKTMVTDSEAIQQTIADINIIINALHTYAKTLSVSNELIELIIESFIASFSTISLACLEPINMYINDNENWTTFKHYPEILAVSTGISELVSSDAYAISFHMTSLAVKLLKNFPTDYDDSKKVSLEISLGLTYANEFYNALNTIFEKINSYNIGATVLNITSELARVKTFYLLQSRGFLDFFDSTNHSSIMSIIDNIVRVFDSGITNPEEYFSFSLNPSLVDFNTFYATKGNSTISAKANLYTSLNSYLGGSSSNLTEIDLGASFKDSSKYYFANAAYAVGFGTLSNIHQIQIDNNIYDTTSIVKADGTVVDQISQTGCTKYRFRQKLFTSADNNSNTQEVEMYIYPGLRDQPFCPTINKYHNMGSCSYSGLFTKLISGTDGAIDSTLFLYKDYKPLEGTIGELIKIGSTDINSIDLSLPNIDLNSADSFIKRQIVALNTSSTLITDGTINTKDLRYYFKASLQGTEVPIEEHSPIAHQGLNVPNAMNFPYLAIIEFIGLPLGSSLKLPSIKILVTASDSQI